MIENLVRENIRKLKPYTSARQSHSEGILLDANENSYGSVLKGELFENINRYPDPYQKELRETVGKFYKVNPKNLFFGVGSDEIIDLLIRIFCNPKFDNVIVCEPTYGMYRVASDINDVAVKNVALTQNYDIDEKEIIRNVDSNTKIIFLCSPNNPTSNLLDRKKILELVKQLNVIVVVDEAYIDFSNENGLIDEAVEYENLVVLRTFSKAWGMAGIRCGFCVTSGSIINLLHKIKSPYNLNKLTSNAVLKAVENPTKYYEFRNMIITQRKIVYDTLKSYDKILNVLPSDSNFISFKVGYPHKVFSYLEQHGIIIRDRSNQFNFNGYLRVTIGTESENNLFLKRLSEIL